MATGGADAKFCQAAWHRVAPCGIVWMRGLGVDHGRPTQQPELMSYLEYLEQSLPGKAKEQSTCHQPIHKWFPGAPYSHFHSISDFLPLRSLGIWEDRRLGLYHFVQEMKKKREQVRASRASRASRAPACVPIGIPMGHQLIISFNGCDLWPIWLFTTARCGRSSRSLESLVSCCDHTMRIWRRSYRCRDEWWALAWCRILSVQLHPAQWLNPTQETGCEL